MRTVIWVAYAIALGVAFVVGVSLILARIAASIGREPQ